MYNHRTNSKKKTSNNAVMYSAALQDHLLRKGNINLLNPHSLKNLNPIDQKPHPKTRTITHLPIIKQAKFSNQTEKRITQMQKVEKRSILPYESEALKYLKQKQSDDQKMNIYNKKLTWAQKLGIVEAPPLPLKAEDWQIIQAKSKQRNDCESICSICLQDFKIEAQAILSCSHVFHHKCLASFEKHNKVHCCPICRKQNYEKKVIDDAIRMFTLKSIIRIQRVFRGSRDRIRIYQNLTQSNYKPQSKLFNRRLIGYKMWKLSNKISKKVKQDQLKYDRMISNMEQQHTKQTNRILDEMVVTQRQKILNEGKVEQYLSRLGLAQERPKRNQEKVYDWSKIMQKGLQRAEDTCSICLTALWSKPVYLLSCTHSFHVNCIEGLQRYSLSQSSKKCPCCRSDYDKKVVQIRK